MVYYVFRQLFMTELLAVFQDRMFCYIIGSLAVELLRGASALACVSA